MRKILGLIIIGFCVNAYADQDQAASLLDDSTPPSIQNTTNSNPTSPRLIIVKPEPSRSATQSSTKTVKQSTSSHHNKKHTKKTKASKNKKSKHNTAKTNKNSNIKSHKVSKKTNSKSNKKAKKKVQ
ncbi:MAG: hypothetical protein PHC75_01970 [Burkholderiales bacterium]|nr:hypothetical protein [Burkholderiales bacterium]